MAAEPSIITADIGDGRQIQFTSKQDVLLFTANFSNLPTFKKAFKQIYNTEDQVGVLFNYYRAKRWRGEIASMLRTTLLSDGTILFDAMKERLKSEGTSLQSE